MVLLPEAIDALMDAAKMNDADIVEGGHYTFTNRRIKQTYPHEFLEDEKGKGMYGYAWGKVIRADLFGEVCFPEGFWYEDTIISYLIYPIAKKTICLPQLVYGYYVNNQGITAQTKTSTKCIDTLSVIELILDRYQHSNKELSPAQKKGTLYQLGPFLFSRTKGLPKELQKAVFVLAAETARRYNLLTVTSEQYYESELIEALKNGQYQRWKWASILI